MAASAKTCEVDCSGRVAVMVVASAVVSVGLSNLLGPGPYGSRLDLPTHCGILGGVSSVTRLATPRRCSIASALDVIGEKWSLLVIRELFIGMRRFNDIAAYTGAPRDILTARLRRLEELGGVARRACSERPPRYEYR